MVTIQKIDGNPSTHEQKISIYMVDNVDDWNEFTEWLYNLEEKEMSLMVSGNVYRFRSMEERRFFVLGFSKAWDVIDEQYVKKYHGDV